MRARGGNTARLLMFGGVLAVAIGLAAVVYVTVGSGGDGGAGDAASPGNPQDTPAGATTSNGPAITIYASPTCGCCGGYADYLQEEGFDVTLERTNGVDEIKDRLRIPEDMRSCHTAVIGDYFVEGHVPVEAIEKLLDEQPAIDGIALPGMPSGTPGMSGSKEEPWVIFAVSNGAVVEFITL